MSTQVIAVIITLLATFLPKLGITIGTEALTTTIQSILVVGSGLWIWYQRVHNLSRVPAGSGDVNAIGVRK